MPIDSYYTQSVVDEFLILKICETIKYITNGRFL